MGLRGAPAQPPRSLLTHVRGAFPRRLPSLRQEPSRLGLSGMAERAPSVPRLAWLRGEEEKGAGAAPAWQPDEVEEVQLLQAGEWLSWSTGLVAAAGWAASHPLWTSPGKEGTGLCPAAGLWPCSIHGAPPAPTCGQRDGGQCPHQPLSRGWPCQGSVGLGCVLQPLPQPLSSACARSLPDPDWDLPEEEEEHTRALFHSRAQVSAAFPAWAGPALAAQLSTAARALDVTSLSSLPFLLLQMFWESLKPTEREETTITAIEGMADSDSYNAEACAAMLDVLVESDASSLEHVSSLWPGLKPPGDRVPLEARCRLLCTQICSAGHPTAF